MRRTYSGLAWAIAGLVFVQAAGIGFGVGGMKGFVQGGGVVDKALVESQSTGNFTGEVGFAVHAINGGMLIPLLALVLVVVSFLARIEGGRRWAGIIFGLVFVQVMAGYSLADLPAVGILHGANALAILLTAVHAARRVPRTVGETVVEGSSTRVQV